MVLVVAAALVDGSGNVLVQQRRAGRSMAGLWEFPGGKVEVGEWPHHALARELTEELGITVAPDALDPISFSQGEHGLLLLLFGCRSWRSDPQPLDAVALRWCAPADLGRLAMPPADLPLIAPLTRWISAGQV
jgi:8-oxo-dGTP diphosphatase